MLEKIRQTAEFLRSRVKGELPKIGIILGSGLGYMGDIVENPIAVPYQNIPHFKVSTAPGHKGQLVFGTLEAFSRRPVFLSMATTDGSLSTTPLPLI